MELHNQTVDLLHTMGIRVARRKRLEPFRLFTLLDRDARFKDHPLKDATKSYLRAVVILRQQGFEPDHKGGHYY